MPWYYAGPDAKPVGPISLEELNGRAAAGVFSPDTYVLEHTGQPGSAPTWRRYREVFPPTPVLPPTPPPFTAPPVPPPIVQAQPRFSYAPPPPAPVTQPHPLFPSAAPVSSGQPRSVFPPDTRPDPFHDSVRKTNGWCQWGFWLGLASVPLLLACGVGSLVALVSLFLCLGGLAQVLHHQEQSGRDLALGGLLLSSFTLLLTIGFLAWAVPAILKSHGLTVTEQSTSDSE